MRQSRFLWKLYGGYVLLTLLTVSFVGVMVSRTIERDSLTDIQESLLARAQLLSGALSILPDSSRADAQNLQIIIQDLGERISTRLTLIDAGGVVRADSEEDPSLMDNHGSRPEVLAARSHGTGQATRFSNTLGTDMMYVAIPVDGGGIITGYVRSSVPLTAVRARLSHLPPPDHHHRRTVCRSDCLPSRLYRRPKNHRTSGRHDAVCPGYHPWRLRASRSLGLN